MWFLHATILSLACLLAARPLGGSTLVTPRNPVVQSRAHSCTRRETFSTAPAGGDKPMEAEMAQGKVKWFNATKGFGFIVPTDGTQDVFVHISAVERAGLGTLNEGQELSFDLVRDRGKTSAGNLKVV